jgi:hypothetical protein
METNVQAPQEKPESAQKKGRLGLQLDMALK